MLHHIQLILVTQFLSKKRSMTTKTLNPKQGWIKDNLLEEEGKEAQSFLHNHQFAVKERVENEEGIVQTWENGSRKKWQRWRI